MTVKEIRKTEAYKQEKVNIKRHAGFKLIGKFYMTDAEKEAWLVNAIRVTEIHLQALKDMLEEKDFN